MLDYYSRVESNHLSASLAANPLALMTLVGAIARAAPARRSQGLE